MSTISAHDSNSAPEPTVRGVAALMLRSPDPFANEVGALLEQVVADHDQPSMCWACNAVGNGMCATYEMATTTAFAWLLKVVEERG